MIVGTAYRQYRMKGWGRVRSLRWALWADRYYQREMLP